MLIFSITGERSLFLAVNKQLKHILQDMQDHLFTSKITNPRARKERNPVLHVAQDKNQTNLHFMLPL